MLKLFAFEGAETDWVAARDEAESTLCRVKQGKLPDAEGLARIISWMVKE